MKGETIFAQGDAETIRQKLRQVRRADHDLQKRLRNELRSMGFYISDFTSSSSGFTAADFDALIQRGTIKVV